MCINKLGNNTEVLISSSLITSEAAKALRVYWGVKCATPLCLQILLATFITLTVVQLITLDKQA
jgi:hypothetical protein